MQFRKSFYNVITGLISQLITIALGIIIPRLVITSFGSETNGLLASISQMLVYVGLLEAGVGTATIQALYGPIAKQDNRSIRSILSATNQYYHKTGAVYFVIVVLFAFLYPVVVRSSIPYFTVVGVILLNGMPNVINFLFQGKYRLLLTAEGKTYILTNLTTVINIFVNIGKIALILLGFNVIALQVMYFAFTIVQMAYILYYIKKHYRWLDLKIKPDYDAISQKNSVLIHQISGLIFNNTDVLILTLFCNLKVVSVYTMYTTLFGMIKAVISNCSSGVTFVLGQTYQVDKKRFLRMHDAFELCNMVLVFSLYCIANVFITPFMKLYTSGVTDINYLDTWLPLLFIATFLLSNGRTSSQQAINYAGHFKKTQWRSIFESCINVVCSLVFVQFFGIYGVLFGTIAALLYRTNDMILYANQKILNRSPFITYRRWLLNTAIFIIVTLICSRIPLALPTYIHIIGWAALYSIVILAVFISINCLFDQSAVRDILLFLKPYVRKILPHKSK